MSADWSADGATKHIHPDGSADPISFGEYVDAVMTQLCDHGGGSVKNKQVSIEQARVCVHNTIPAGVVSKTSYLNYVENLSLDIRDVALEAPTERMLITHSQSVEDNRHIKTAMADPDRRSDGETIAVVE